MQVNAGRYIVKVKELSWWETQEVQAILTSGAKMTGAILSGFDGPALIQANALAFERSIVSIQEGDAEVKFSQEWLKGLTVEEGDAIKAAIDELGKKK